MRWVVLLLVLLNAALFGYFKLSVQAPSGAVAGHEAIEADKLKIVSAEELAALPKKSTSTTPNVPTPTPQPLPEQTACYEWGSFSAPSVSRVKNILSKFPVQSEIKQTATQEATRYWIYIPPLASAEKAQAKNIEVRSLGVEESFVVQEPQWRNAISLGVFREEALAAKFLEDLHGRGVKSAVKGVRNNGTGQSSFMLRNVTDAIASEIDKLKPDFSGSEFKKVACQ